MGKIVAVDLDHTLCIPKTGNSYEKYGLADPIPRMIDLVNKLYDEGHTVVIYTARRMLTHDGDIVAVIEDIGEITNTWLKEHGVKFHYIQYGKLYFDVLIDDKGVRPEELGQSEHILRTFL